MMALDESEADDVHKAIKRVLQQCLNFSRSAPSDDGLVNANKIQA